MFNGVDGSAARVVFGQVHTMWSGELVEDDCDRRLTDSIYTLLCVIEHAGHVRVVTHVTEQCRHPSSDLYRTSKRQFINVHDTMFLPHFNCALITDRRFTIGHAFVPQRMG